MDINQSARPLRGDLHVLAVESGFETCLKELGFNGDNPADRFHAMIGTGEKEDVLALPIELVHGQGDLPNAFVDALQRLNMLGRTQRTAVQRLVRIGEPKHRQRRPALQQYLPANPVCHLAVAIDRAGHCQGI